MFFDQPRSIQQTLHTSIKINFPLGLILKPWHFFKNILFSFFGYFNLENKHGNPFLVTIDIQYREFGPLCLNQRCWRSQKNIQIKISRSLILVLDTFMIYNHQKYQRSRSNSEYLGANIRGIIAVFWSKIQLLVQN